MLLFKIGDRVRAFPVALQAQDASDGTFQLPFRLFCGELHNKWPHLSQIEVESIDGDLEQLSKLLETTYGCTPQRAKRELDHVVREFCEKIRLAA